MAKQKMVFKQLNITRPQNDFLLNESKETGLTVSELIRTAVGDFMQKRLRDKDA